MHKMCAKLHIPYIPFMFWIKLPGHNVFFTSSYPFRTFLWHLCCHCQPFSSWFI